MRPYYERTDANSPSPVGLRVTTSHFSGVVTIICVSAISALVSCISPILHVSCQLRNPAGSLQTCELSHKDIQPLQPFSKLPDDLRSQRLHRRTDEVVSPHGELLVRYAHIDYLESVPLNGGSDGGCHVGRSVLIQYPQDR